jgi:hypothetical protein
VLVTRQLWLGTWDTARAVDVEKYRRRATDRSLGEAQNWWSTGKHSRIVRVAQLPSAISRVDDQRT